MVAKKKLDSQFNEPDHFGRYTAVFTAVVAFARLLVDLVRR